MNLVARVGAELSCSNLADPHHTVRLTSDCFTAGSVAVFTAR